MGVADTLARSGGARGPLDVGRLALRAGRRSLRGARRRQVWWNLPLDRGSGRGSGPGSGSLLRLIPAEPSAADRWERLVASSGTGPEAAGVAASPLGGAAAGSRDWTRRCLDLRARARRGGTYLYLVELDGMLVGEALGFVDGGTNAVELVVWLSPDVCGSQTHADTAELLALHVLAGPEAPDRAIISAAVDDAETAVALAATGFVLEGVLHDPPRPDRAVFVAHRSARPLVTVAP